MLVAAMCCYGNRVTNGEAVSDYGSAKFEEQFMSIGPGCFAYSAPEVQRPAKQTAKVRK